MSSFEERLIEAQTILTHRVNELIGNEDHRLQYLAQHFKHMVKDRFSGEMKRIEIGLHKLIHGTTQIIDSQNNMLKLTMSRIAGGLNILLQQQENRVTHCGQAIRLLDPVNVLKRGYSITYLNEKAIRDSADVQQGDIIRTRIYKGSIKSKVEAVDVEK
jgi:exodeoxyribonuclease VII large subunit